MEIETRSFQMQKKSFVLSQRYAAIAVSLFLTKLWRRLRAGGRRGGGGTSFLSAVHISRKEMLPESSVSSSCRAAAAVTRQARPAGPALTRPTIRRPAAGGRE